LADNRIAQSAGWDRERLASELSSLPDLLVADGLDITAAASKRKGRGLLRLLGRLRFH
jgi:hypothetical protein